MLLQPCHWRVGRHSPLVCSATEALAKPCTRRSRVLNTEIIAGIGRCFGYYCCYVNEEPPGGRHTKVPIATEQVEKEFQWWLRYGVGDLVRDGTRLAFVFVAGLQPRVSRPSRYLRARAADFSHTALTALAAGVPEVSAVS